MLEYEEMNRYGRTVYETIFRLAQMTFVLNPALGVGFYYVFFEKKAALFKEEVFNEVGVAAIAIAIFGVVYNLGAHGVHVQPHAFLEALLVRIRVCPLQQMRRSFRQSTVPANWAALVSLVGAAQSDGLKSKAA